MKKRWSRLLSGLLTLVMVFALVDGVMVGKVDALSSSDITAKMDSLQSKYPNETYLGYIEYGGGKECYAFARMMAYDIFGSYPGSDWAYSSGYTDANGWTFISNSRT